MGNQQKIIFNTVGFPIASCTAIMLFLDNQLFETKSCLFKEFHDIKGQRDHMTFLTRIAHEKRTEFILLQYTVTFSSDLFHFY